MLLPTASIASIASSAAIFLACTVPTADPTEGSRGNSSSIIGGTASTNTADNSVVLLAMPGTFCTGTLIAPNLVLTARHCVSEANENAQGPCSPFASDKAPNTIGVALGERPSSAAVVARGTKLFLEPISSVCGQDIALVLLDKNVPTVTPKKVRLTAPVVGEQTTAIGYGQDEQQQIVGRKIRTNIPVQAVGPATRTASVNGQSINVSVPANDFLTGESVCHGDSGGPLFDVQGKIIGTTSRGTPLGCVGAPALFSSTAGHANLIKTALLAAGHPFDAATPDAGSDASTSVPGAPNGGTTTPGGGDNPGGPTPGAKDGGAAAPSQSDDNAGGGNEDGTKDKGNTTPEDDEEESPRPSKKGSSFSSQPTAGSCAATSSRGSNDGGSSAAFLVALSAAFAFVVRRRRSTSAPTA